MRTQLFDLLQKFDEADEILDVLFSQTSLEKNEQRNKVAELQGGLWIMRRIVHELGAMDDNSLGKEVKDMLFDESDETPETEPSSGLTGEPGPEGEGDDEDGADEAAAEEEEA